MTISFKAEEDRVAGFVQNISNNYRVKWIAWRVTSGGAFVLGGNKTYYNSKRGATLALQRAYPGIEVLSAEKPYGKLVGVSPRNLVLIPLPDVYAVDYLYDQAAAAQTQDFRGKDKGVCEGMIKAIMHNASREEVSMEYRDTDFMLSRLFKDFVPSNRNE